MSTRLEVVPLLRTSTSMPNKQVSPLFCLLQMTSDEQKALRNLHVCRRGQGKTSFSKWDSFLGF